MKKTYMIPEMEVVNIHSVQLLAGSANLGSGSLPDVDLEDILLGTDLSADAPETLISDILLDM